LAFWLGCATTRPRLLCKKAGGCPPNASDPDYFEDYHSCGWLSLQELTDFDYDQEMEDRRVTIQTGPNSWFGGHTAEPGGGKKMSYRQFLGEAFFADLKDLQDAGAERVIFGFDS
jgi:hypothetical protein